MSKGICDHCQREREVVVRAITDRLHPSLLCLGCIANRRIAGHDVFVTTPRPREWGSAKAREVEAA